MRKRGLGVLVVIAMLLISACGNSDSESLNQNENETMEVAEANAVSTEVVESKDAEENVSAEEISSLETEDYSEIENEAFPVSVRIDNPSWDYYIAESVVSGTKPYKLKVMEESTNKIIDTEEWLADHEWNAVSPNMEEKYKPLIESGGTLVSIFENGTCIAELDFEDYRYAPDLVEENREFVEETVQDAKVINGILYVSVFHYTYANFAPSNAYIVAINLEDYSVIWKSQPLVCNSLNFEIVEDIIFCGYGFTQEMDYLYQLDRITGCVLGRIELKSKADYIICADDILSVRTYNTDYAFEIIK